MIKDLAVSEVEFVAFRLAREKMTYNEPIPEFATRFPNILESCLAVPFQRFQKRSFYRGIVEKAAILFYLLIKNHPFQNGNKRIAMTILFVFLYKNKKWLKVDNRELYNFAVWVAESNPRLKTEVVAAVQKFIETCLVSL
jgi:death-on-curing family protein